MKKLSRIFYLVAAFAALSVLTPNISRAENEPPPPPPPPPPPAETMITISEKELNERQNKFFQNGLAERENRFNKSLPELFKTHNLPFNESLEKTLATIADVMKQSTQNTDQRLVDSEVKIKALQTENDSWAQRYTSKEEEVRNYIINQEILSAVSGKAVDPQLVSSALRQYARIEQLKDGSVKVYKSNGEVWYNKTGDPMTVAEIADQFLSERPYLQKTEVRGGGGGGERTGIGGNLANKDPHTFTPAEEAAVFDQFMKGDLRVGN